MLPHFTLHGHNTNENSQHDTFQSYYSLDFFNAKITYSFVLHVTEYDVNTRILDQGSKKRLCTGQLCIQFSIRNLPSFQLFK